MNRPNSIRRNPEPSNRILPCVLRNRDRPIGAPQNPIGKFAIRLHVARRMNLRHQPASQIVNRHRQLRASRRPPQQIRGVKYIRVANQPVERRKPNLVHRFDQRKPSHRRQPRNRARLMIELPEIIDVRKRTNIRALFPDVPRPVPDVILNARAAHQGRSSVDDYAHARLSAASNLHSYGRLRMRLFQSATASSTKTAPADPTNDTRDSPAVPDAPEWSDQSPARKTVRFRELFAHSAYRAGEVSTPSAASGAPEYRNLLSCESERISGAGP